MDFTSMLGLVGLGTSLFGGLFGASNASKEAKISQQEAGVSENIVGVQQQQNQLREDLMNVQGRRSQLETVRNAQRARAMAIQSGVSGGSQMGTGLLGGIYDVKNQETEGLLSTGQQIQAGNKNFGFENQITGYKQQMAGLQGQMAGLQGNIATDQGIASLGGALMKSSPMLGNIAKNYGFG